MDTKTCGRCHQPKPLTEFGIDNRRGRPKAICKKCDSEIHRISYSNPSTPEEKLLRRLAASERAKRRRARRRESGICTECESPAEEGTFKCTVHLAKAIEKEATRRVKLLRVGKCTRCGNNPPASGRRTCDECSKLKQGYNPRYKRVTIAHHREQAKRRYAELKDECYAAYGGYRCTCCGETERLFLTIDHMANDGAKHRHAMYENKWFGAIYGWLRRNGFPSGFQILCHNCNTGKHRNGGICPHKTQTALPA